MPGYPFLAQTPLDAAHIAEQMRTLRIVGVPYTDAQIDNASADLIGAERAGRSGRRGAARALSQRRPQRCRAAKSGVTEEDALIAYLQHLGVSVDFKLYDDKARGECEVNAMSHL